MLGFVLALRETLRPEGLSYRGALFGDAFGVVGLVPGEGAFEAFFEKDGRLVREKFPGEADVGEGIADVAFTGRFVFCLQSLTGGFLEH